MYTGKLQNGRTLTCALKNTKSHPAYPEQPPKTSSNSFRALRPHACDLLDPGPVAAQVHAAALGGVGLEVGTETKLQPDADAEGTERMQEKRQGRYLDVI